MTDRPFVLIVDDDEGQESFALLLAKYGVEAQHVLPDDVTLGDLARASLLLIDEYIEHWPARERVKDQPALYVRDGVALAAVLRAQLEQRGPVIADSTPSRTAVVLRTGHLEHLASGLPRQLWSPAVASRYDLEWVVQKSVPANKVAAIAHAAAALPTEWDPASPAEQRKWLALGEASWAADAIAHIEECRPPWSTLSATSAGRLWLSWFMQRVLPFSTFLVDDLRASAYLGLQSSALDEILAGRSELAPKLEDTKYTGELSEFAGRRWWRAGISAMRSELLEESGGRGPLATGVRIAEIHGAKLDQLGLSYPVFTINNDYETSSEPIEVTEAVRLQPDGWPSYADDPWLARSDIADEPELAKLIVLDDRAGKIDDGNY